VLDAKDDPNDGNGIGRVVREVQKGWQLTARSISSDIMQSWKQNSDYPMYTDSTDKGFVQACEELLGQQAGNPAMG
jgi:hypothetical protein